MSGPPPSLALRSESLAARAALAWRRTGRFALIAAVAFVVILLVLLIVPQLGGPTRAVAVPLPRADTAPLVVRADSAHHVAAHADSQYAAMKVATAQLAAGPPGMTPVQRASRDSLQLLASELDTLLARAAKAPLPASYRALAAAAALHRDPRTAKLTDSLDALEKRRAALSQTNGADLPFADITALVNDVGLAIRNAATHRRERLAQTIADFTAAATTSPAIDTAGARQFRDSTQAAVAAIDSTLTAARTQNAAADRQADTARDRANRRVPPVAMLLAALMLAVIAGFSFNLSAEINNPTLATPREAERVAQAPILAVARDRDRILHIGGIDAFRMLYLGLTATGTRTRTVIVTGDDRAVIATVAGRVALAAAADARATLVVDADPEASPVAGYFMQRPEPGFSDALAGVRLWREVATPVGASDGLSIDVVPGGAIRREALDDATKESAREEFARFRAEYDFCVIVAPPENSMALLCSLVVKSVIVLCAELGETSLARVRADAERIRKAGGVLHGLALWETELPTLTPRAELMAKIPAGRVRRPTPEGQ